MDSTELLRKIEKLFPLIDKPARHEISAHNDDCFQCHYLREESEKYDIEISRQGLRWFHNELSLFSGKGLVWVLTSLLRYCVSVDDTYDGAETEFLIYHLSPAKEYENDTISQLEAFSRDQIGCLMSFISWCKAHQYWKDYCLEDIEKAECFLKKINA